MDVTKLTTEDLQSLTQKLKTQLMEVRNESKPILQKIETQETPLKRDLQILVAEKERRDKEEWRRNASKRRAEARLKRLKAEEQYQQQYEREERERAERRRLETLNRESSKTQSVQVKSLLVEAEKEESALKEAREQNEQIIYSKTQELRDALRKAEAELREELEKTIVDTVSRATTKRAEAEKAREEHLAFCSTHVHPTFGSPPGRKNDEENAHYSYMYDSKLMWPNDYWCTCKLCGVQWALRGPEDWSSSGFG